MYFMFYILRFSPGFSFNQNGLPPPPPPYTTIHLNFLNILTDKLHLFEVPALIPSEVHQNSHLVSAVLQSPGPGMMMVTTWHLSLPPNDHPPPVRGQPSLHWSLLSSSYLRNKSLQSSIDLIPNNTTVSSPL